MCVCAALATCLSEVIKIDVSICDDAYMMQPKPSCTAPPLLDAVQHFLLLNVFIIYELINFLLLLLLLVLLLLLQSCCPARIRRQHRLLCLLWPLASLDGATDRASQVSNYPESETIESCPHRLNLFQIVVATATAACCLLLLHAANYLHN